MFSCAGRKEGRGCHARDAIEAYGVKRSASVTGFVLAEGTHQTDVFSANFHRYELISMTQGGRVPDVTTCWRCDLLTSRPAEGSRPATPSIGGPPQARLQQLPGLPSACSSRDVRARALARPPVSTAVGAVRCLVLLLLLLLLLLVRRLVNMPGTSLHRHPLGVLLQRREWQERSL